MYLVFFIEEAGEAVEAEFPMRAVLLDPLLEQGKAGGFNAAGANAAYFLGAHEIALFEDLKVLADGCESDAEGLGESRDRDRASAQQVEDGAAGGIAERVKEAIDLGSWSGHHRLVQ